MGALYDRVGMTTATTGTGTLTLGSAITDATNGDYLTFADAGVANTTVVNYLIVNGNNFELGTGTYTSSGTTLSRGATLSKAGGTKGTTAITLVGSSNVYIVPQAAAGNTWNVGSANDFVVTSGANASLTVSNNNGSKIVYGSNQVNCGGSFTQVNGGGGVLFVDSFGSKVSSGNLIGWGSSGANGSSDTALGRNAAGIVEVNNGTAGTFATLKTGGLRVGYVAKTTTYTAVVADGLISANATGGAFTVTLPTAVGADGQTYTIKKVDSSANAVTVGTTSSQTIDGSTTYALSAQWNTVTVVSNGANWLIQSKV